MKFIYHSANWKIGEKFKIKFENKINHLCTKYSFLTDKSEIHLYFEIFKELRCILKTELFLKGTGKQIIVKTKKDNAYIAIHDAVDKIDIQLKKIKEKMSRH